MNIPGITRALELDDADWDLAVKLRGLTEHQREQFSAALGPVKPQKKPSKKSAGKGGGKSKHASSLESTIKGRGSAALCVAELASTGKPCGMARPHVIHSEHNQDVDAHDFLSAARLQKQQEPTVGGFADDTDMVRCQFTRSDGKLCLLLPDHNIHHMTTAMEYHEFQPQSAEQAAATSGD